MARVSTGADSKQDYHTPDDLKEAVELRYGPIAFDLAAHKDNKMCDRYICAPDLRFENTDAWGVDSFNWDWAEISHILPAGSLLWLNPPFKQIEPWAEKCLKDSPRFKPGVRLAFLTPASVGAKWFIKNCYQKAYVNLLDGRPSFDGQHPFPKDCQITIYSADRIVGIESWAWQMERERHIIRELKA